MGLRKPYRRIVRPFVEDLDPGTKKYIDCGWDECHLADSEYAEERITLVRAFNVIEQDLKMAFNYLEPADGNLRAFSHRLYELLLRSCTEFEANCRGILTDNGYTKPGELNVRDYHKIEQSSRLSEYEVEITAWRRTTKVLQPFDSWSGSHSLGWYQAYNTVKHNRSKAFEFANLQNVLLAVSGLLAILLSQFWMLSFNAHQFPAFSCDDQHGWFWCQDSIFRAKPPRSWTHDECYDFCWKDIRRSPDRFANYPFS